MCFAGTGQFGAVGFSYGGHDEGGSGSGSASGTESDSESEGDEGGEDDGEGIGDADGLAANLGIDSFSAVLRRAEREEAATALGLKPRKKCACASGLPPKPPACARVPLLRSSAAALLAAPAPRATIHLRGVQWRQVRVGVMCRMGVSKEGVSGRPGWVA